MVRAKDSPGPRQIIFLISHKISLSLDLAMALGLLFCGPDIVPSVEKFDFLIVGAGFAGTVLAERIASQLGKSCLVVEKRHHIGGNAYDHYDAAGVLVHDYGPHYFRTNSQRVIDYLSQFTEWREVEYKILSWTHGRYWHFPINLNAFEQLIGRPSTTEEMEAQLAEWRVKIDSPKNSEEVIVSQVGWKLYEMFFKNYTRKQWQRDAKDLDPSVCGRIPVRTNRDDRYLSERFQALPRDGYTSMFKKMLAHPLIEIRLNTDYRHVRAHYQKYAERAAFEQGVTFVGRLATYRYYNMDQVVGTALTEFDRIRVRLEGQKSEIKGQMSIATK